VLVRVLDAERALLLAVAARGDSVVVVEEATVTREAHERLMRDRRSPSDIGDVDRARGRVGIRREPKDIGRER